MKPVGRNLILKVTQDKYQGSLIILEEKKKKKPQGEVVSVGRFVEADIEVGDEVMFTKTSTKKLEGDLVLCPENSLTIKI
jgi:co-chaperonin GroES (HSP10)